MPEQQDKASKTEEPTSKKIREERQKGNVLKSEELNSLILLLGGAMFVTIAAPWLKQVYEHVFRLISTIDCTRTWGTGDLVKGFHAAIKIISPIVAALFGFFGLLSVAACWCQSGPYFEIEAMRPKPEQLNPVKGFKQIVPNSSNLVKLSLILVKISIIGGIIYLAIRENMEMLVAMPLQQTVEEPAVEFLKIVLMIAVKILGVFIVVAVIDLIYRNKERHEKMMMTKQEVQDERRNTEGDPQMKQKRKSKMREMSLSRMITEVSDSDVVLTNPTHVAVALRYKAGDEAPRVVAKGLRKRAEKIKQLARQAGVPIIEEKQLARALYRHTKLQNCIKSDYFKAVALVLAQLQRRGIRDFSNEGRTN